MTKQIIKYKEGTIQRANNGRKVIIVIAFI